MPSQLNLIRDAAGNNTFGLEFADIKYNTTLALGVEQSQIIIGSAHKWLAIFSYEPGSSVWVSKNAPAVLPGASFADTDAELNPTARVVRPNDVLHFITSNTDAKIGIVLHAIQ